MTKYSVLLRRQVLYPPELRARCMSYGSLWAMKPCE